MCRLLSLLLGHLVWPSQWSDRHVSQSLECIVCYTPFPSTVGYQPWCQRVASLNSCNTAAISLMGGLFSIIFHMHLVTLDTSLRQHLWFSGPIFFGEHPCSGSFLIGPPLTCEGEQELVVLIVNHLKWLSCQTTWLCQELWMYLEIFRHRFGTVTVRVSIQLYVLCCIEMPFLFFLTCIGALCITSNGKVEETEQNLALLLLNRFSEEFLSYRRDNTSSTQPVWVRNLSFVPW